MPPSALSSPRASPPSSFTSSDFSPKKPAPAAPVSKISQPSLATPHKPSFFTKRPHRIADTLSDLESVFGPALRVVAARELTKLHEEFLRGTVAEIRQNLAARDRIRGEFVLLIEAPAKIPGAPGLASETWESVSAKVARLQSESGLDEKEALKRLARESGQSKSELYRELQRERARLR